MKNKFSVILFFLLFLLIQKSEAQLPYFRTIEIDKSIEGIKVQVMSQDRQKILWLGTNKGVYRYDGSSFKLVSFEKNVKDEMFVSALYCDASGMTWVGTRRGNIFTYNDDSLRLLKTESPLPKEKISGIIQDNQNRMWFSTYGEGVYVLAENHFYNFTSEDGMKDENVYTITANKSGTIWVGTDGGISECTLNADKKSVVNYTTATGLNDNIVTKLIWDEKENRLWYGTQGSGIGCLYLSDSIHFEIPDASKNWNAGSVESMLLLERSVWVGTNVGGLVDFEIARNPRVRYFLNTDEFKYSVIQSLFRDDEGNIWVACKDKLLESPGEKIEFKKTENGIPVENIHASLMDAQHRLWFSNDSGLRRITFNQDGTESEKTFSFLSGVKGFKILTIYQDAFGFIWIGTFDHGVFRVDAESGAFFHIDDKKGLLTQSVLSVSGKLSSVWLATLGGAIKIELGDDAQKLKCKMSYEYFNSSNGLLNNFIYQVLIDRYNRVWFAQDGRSISMLDNEGLHSFGEKEGLDAKSYFAITEDINGGLWFASTDNGLYRLKNYKESKKFIHYNLDNGLPSIHLSSLCADKVGNIVIVCQEGIAVYNLTAEQFNWYHENEGITSVDADLNTTSLASDGVIWIGGKHEFILMNTAIGKYRIAPFITLESANALLQPLDLSKYESISANRNHLSFSFNGIWFSNPSEVSFQYKLEGLNRDWITTRDRTVTFSDLNPSRYTFRLRCSRTGDFSRSDEINYSFAILNPIYLQWWFIILVLAGLVALVWLFLKFRDQRMNVVQKLEKEKIASQLETLKNQVNPHFLFNSFNTLANIIEEDKDKAVDYIERMTDFFRQILVHREKNLISLEEEMEIINDYIYLQKQRFDGAMKTEINISEEQAKNYFIPPLVVQLLVENSIKHNSLTTSNPLLIEIFFEDGFFIVRNNLSPKLNKEPSTGTGLQNISRRMDMLDLDAPQIIKTESHFIVKLKLPIKND